MFLSLRLWVACAYLSWTGRWRTNGEVMSISTPHITSQRETATEAIIIVIKNAFLQELMCSRLPTWTSLLSCRKKHKALLTFLHNTIKTPPPNSHTSQWRQFGKTVTLRHVTVSTLSSVKRLLVSTQCRLSQAPGHLPACNVHQMIQSTRNNAVSYTCGSPRLTRFKGSSPSLSYK